MTSARAPLDGFGQAVSRIPGVPRISPANAALALSAPGYGRHGIAGAGFVRPSVSCYITIALSLLGLGCLTVDQGQGNTVTYMRRGMAQPGSAEVLGFFGPTFYFK